MKLCLKNLDWTERLKIIDTIKWDSIKFNKENREFLVIKFIEIISFYFDEYDEKLEGIATNLNKFLFSLASHERIIMRNLSFFKGFTSILLNTAHDVLIENSEQFLGTLIKEINADTLKESVKNFEEYIKESYSVQVKLPFSSIKVHHTILKAISDANPNILSRISKERREINHYQKN